MLQTTQEIKPSKLSALIKDYTVYGLWANKTMVNWLKTKPAELLDKELPSSFPGIKQTLAHIWHVEMAWMGYIKKAPVQVPYGQTYTGSAADVFNDLLSTSEELNNYVQSLQDEELEEVIHVQSTYMNSHLARYEMIQHCVTHDAYHRGQIVTMGRQLGFTDAPMTDFLFYLDRIKGK